MRSHDAMKDKEAVTAARESAKGAAIGALKWGSLAAVLAGVGHATSPIYKNLTIQFKIYIQMSAMIVGGALEADHRLREYEAAVRMQRRRARDQALWEDFERRYPKGDDDE